MRYLWSQKQNGSIYPFCNSAFTDCQWRHVNTFLSWWKSRRNYSRSGLKMRNVSLQSLWHPLKLYINAFPAPVITCSLKAHIKKAFRRRISRWQAKAMSFKGWQLSSFSHYWPSLDLQALSYFLHGNTDEDRPADTPVHPHVLIVPSGHDGEWMKVFN